jgi:hypothetical protein
LATVNPPIAVVILDKRDILIKNNQLIRILVVNKLNKA